MLVIAPPHHRNGRPPHRVLLALVAAALLLHAALLSGARLGLQPTESSSPGASVQVRLLQAPQPVSVPAVEPVATPPRPVSKPAQIAKPAVKPAARSAVKPGPAQTAPAVEAPPVEAPRSEAAASQAASELAVPADAAASASAVTAVAAAASAAGSSEAALALYRTQFAPPLTLLYELRRGALSGTAELNWRPSGTQYELRLEGSAAGSTVLLQTSQGGFDAAGLAPLRFTDQRMQRETRAANFQREQGKITFSGPSTEYPLRVGAQDRLSWMLQLAAVAAAEPLLLAPDGKIALYVVGARGDADLWVFRYVAHETVDTASGPVRAVKFAREPRGAYDTQVEAWLDPARHHLPVRARLSTSPDGDALELLLREMKIPVAF